MEYQVPQFIDVEDKVVGPFSFKQFVYLAGGAGLCAILILYLPLYIGILLSIPVAALSGALAFYKVNNKSFVEMLEAGFNFYLGSRLYLWKKEPKETPAAPVAAAPEAITREKLTLSNGKLKDLAWALDIQEQGSDTTNP